MDKAALKAKVLEIIDQEAEKIISIGNQIFDNPELGFKEHATAAVVKQTFEELQLPHEAEIAITGLRAELAGRKQDLKVAVMGELDAVLCYDHPKAHPETGATHACGHNAQIAGMLGAAIGLVKAGAAEHLDGSIVFLAVPAEEFVELEYRNRLREEGKIEFFGGKQEFIRLGVFDDIDISIMFHSESDCPGRRVMVGGSSNGFIGKSIRYIGREAHAGGAPFEGINALNAALLGLMGIHAQRETFRDEDHIRVHPIITRGGDLVNIVPADVRLETYVRGRTLEAILDANRKVNRALLAGADAVGAEIEIGEIPGYLPLRNDPNLSEIFRQNASDVIGAENVGDWGGMGGSTDMGDVTHLIPGIHPAVGGIKGTAHTRNFLVSDPDAAYIVPAKVMALTVIDLLYEGAELARKVKQEFKPAMTKDEYLKMWRDLVAK
ncbi:MAG: amidohydrolase [Bacillota bacterium]|jgi:amidohydrolase